MLTLNPRKTPSLPQFDTPHKQSHREEQLARAKHQYVWSDKVENVEGVPMAKTLPPDSTPTLEWLLKLSDVVIEIIENKLLNFVDDDLEEVSKIEKKLKSIQRSHRLIHSNLKIPFIGGLISKARIAFFNDIDVIREEVESLIGILQRHPNKDSEPTPQLYDYQSLFESIELDSRAENFYTDEMFVYYRVAGPNPMLLECVTELPSNFAVEEAGFKKVMGSGDSLAEALVEDRLFVLDYRELKIVADNPGEFAGLPKHLYTPIVLFAKAKGEEELRPVAIQRTQEKDARGVSYRAAPSEGLDYWRWQTAKSQVEMAEGNYHELFVHLARTHLVIEAFALSTHRNLSERHPLNILLLPHFEGTFFINNAAASSLIHEGGPIDRIFAAEISVSQQAAGMDRLEFDFYANMLPNQLKARRIDSASKLAFYPYRDDALLIWNAIGAWVEEYCGLYYASDEDVQGDPELSAWSAELIEMGKMKGFVQITSREQLVQVLTMLIFTASAQHAAVNFPQSPIMTYAPAISGALWGPEGAVGDTETAWLQTMAPLKLAELQLGILHLLGGIFYRPLGEYKTNDFPYTQWFKDKRVIAKEGPLVRFQEQLKRIEDTIITRNESRDIPYSFLQPSRIPMSINI